jgi:hypothetical protein
MHRRIVFFKVKKVGHLVNELKTPCLTAFWMGSMTDPEPKTCHNTLNICAILQHCLRNTASHWRIHSTPSNWLFCKNMVNHWLSERKLTPAIFIYLKKQLQF